MEVDAYELALDYLTAGMIVFCQPIEEGVKVVGGYAKASHIKTLMSPNRMVRAAFLLSAGTTLVKRFDEEARKLREEEP